MHCLVEVAFLGHPVYVPLTYHLKRDNAGHGEVTINNAATVPARTG